MSFDVNDLKNMDDNTINDLFSKLEAMRNSSQRAIQIRDVVPVERWLESEYYVGKDGLQIYDYWKQVIYDIYTNPTKINEVILAGSIGIGKTTLAVFLMIRKLYELSCYKNIPLLFPNMMPNSNIVFTYFMLTKKQAERTGFSQFRSTVDNIPYFRQEFPRNLDKNSVLEWTGRNLAFIYGSSTDDFIGMNALGSILDEANFFKVGAGGETTINPDYSKVFNLYQTIIDRSKSRFASHGTDNSLSILVSSSTTASSFTEQRIKASQGDPSTYVINAKLWEVKPRGTYQDKYFWAFAGSDLVDPMVIYSVEDVNQFMESVGLQTFNPQFVSIDYAVSKVPQEYTQLFIKIPEDFRKNFETNIMKALQNIAGFSVSPIGRLFSSRPIYNKCIVDYLRHPFTKDSITVSTGDSTALKDYLKPGFRFLNPENPHFIHVDQSTTSDCTGISMCHIEKVEDVNGVPRPIIAMDFSLQITPPPQPRKISIAKVRDFIFYLRDHMGVAISKVSYDRHASADSLQILTEGGFDTGLVSVDRNDGAYMALVNLFYEEQIHIYDYKPFSQELFSLVHYRERRKVDHQPNFSKDVADSLCGAVFNALEFDLSTIYLYDRDYSNAFLVVNSRDDHDEESHFSLRELAPDYHDERVYDAFDKDMNNHIKKRINTTMKVNKDFWL